MGHVDDGTLNALLDDELDGAEAAEVRAHLAGCAECAARFQDAQRFLEEAAELLGVLVPPVAKARPEAAPPAEPPAAVAPGPVAVAPLSPIAPAAPAAPGGPPRRVSTTAKEVAIDIDGATHKSPAIVPNFPEEGEQAPMPRSPSSGRQIRPLYETRPEHGRHRPDWATLAWAASVILAIGVGYLWNEVQHSRTTLASSDVPVAATQPPARPAAPPAAGRAERRPAAEAKNLSGLAANRPRGTRPAATAGPKPETNLAAADAAPLADAAGRIAQPAQVAAEVAGAPGRPAPLQAAGAAARGDELGRAARPAAQPAAAAAAPLTRAAPAPFRVTNVDSAAARLAGVLRTVDGLALESVKIGSGALVPGAMPTADVVRIVYTDLAGRRLQLDQQRLPQTTRDTSRAARERAVPPALGLTYGDTLVTIGTAGEARLRWLDRSGLWMSLTGNVPADSLRALLARVR